MADNNDNQDSGEKEVKKSTGNKLENPDAIPSAGGKKIGEEHMGESKRLGENERSNEEGGDDLQRQLEGKKKTSAGKEEGGEKQGMLKKAEEKLGLHKKEEK